MSAQSVYAVPSPRLLLNPKHSAKLEYQVTKGAWLRITVNQSAFGVIHDGEFFKLKDTIIIIKK